MFQCWYQHNHGREAAIRIHTAVSIKILEGPLNQTVYLHISPFQFSRADQPLLSPITPSPSHAKRNHILLLPESKTGRSWSCTEFPEGEVTKPLEGCSLPVEFIRVDINKKLIINLKSGKVERILTAAVWGLRQGGNIHWWLCSIPHIPCRSLPLM